MSGWIFGSKDQAKWTQAHFSKKTSFQNPLRQTYRQKKVLAEFLDIPQNNIHTIVYFVGRCEFKTKLPSNVMARGLKRYIESFEDEILTEDEADEIIDLIEDHKDGSKLTKREHSKSLKKRHSSTSQCPKCGEKLVERMVRNGPKSGSKFLGCKGFPTGYNVVAIPLAAGVLFTYGIMISPAVGAALMSLSTIICAVNAQLLRFSFK